ncbi:MAG TPA: hypothetical protein VFM70_10635 [Salinimicrobium sp.]|nr:hypothetical protein [Salinimicrobium sp.]
MSRLTVEEKLNLVLELVEKHRITAYEIGENTDLNSSGVHRILTGEVKKPREKTLNLILQYIESRIVGTDIGLKAAEPIPEYSRKDKVEEVLQELRSLRREFTYSSEMIAKGVELSLLNTEELLVKSEELDKKVSENSSSLQRLEIAIQKSLSRKA